MGNNTYYFQSHNNLSPAELFLWIALDQTKTQLGFADLAAVATWLLSVNDVPVSGKMKTATEGTSVLSMFFRSVIKKRAPMRLPTLTWKSVTEFRFIYTKSLGGFVGRAIPVLDVVFLGYDATVIMYRTVSRYNSMVDPEDRLG